jgi:hypothetical protein
MKMPLPSTENLSSLQNQTIEIMKLFENTVIKEQNSQIFNSFSHEFQKILESI